jgi:hypothetical protein
MLPIIMEVADQKPIFCARDEELAMTMNEDKNFEPQRRRDFLP